MLPNPCRKLYARVVYQLLHSVSCLLRAYLGRLELCDAQYNARRVFQLLLSTDATRRHSSQSAHSDILYARVGCLVSTALGPCVLLFTRAVPASALTGLPGKHSSWSARPAVNARVLYLLLPSVGCLVSTALGPRALPCILSKTMCLSF
jgi:hypothetical protein